MKQSLGFGGRLVLALALAFAGAAQTARAATWGRVSVGQDSAGRYVAVLENSQLRVRYGYQVIDGRPQTAITDFVLRAVGENQAGRFLDGGAGRGVLTQASVKTDGERQKTLHLEWDNGARIEEVSIFPDGAYIQIDYLKFGVDVLDLGVYGDGSGAYRFWGGENWVRDYVRHPASYYNRVASDGGTDPSDGGALNYRGYFIGGVYRSSGRGFARIMPVAAGDILKLLAGQGLQAFPYYGRPPAAYTGYLLAVTGGADGLIADGRAILDSRLPPLTHRLAVDVVGQGSVTRTPDLVDYTAGTVVTLTANAAVGWTFTGWGGGLSGSLNPAALALAADTAVTATFTQNRYTLTVNVQGAGTVSRAPDLADYAHGSAVTLAAQPQPGWAFADWAGDLSGRANPASVVLTGPRTVTARFVLLPVTGITKTYLPQIAGGQ